MTVTAAVMAEICVGTLLHLLPWETPELIGWQCWFTVCTSTFWLDLYLGS